MWNVWDKDRHILSSSIFLGDDTEWAGTLAHHYQKDEILYPSLSFFFHHILGAFSDTCISPGADLIHLNGRPFVPSMLWVAFWNFSHKMWQWTMVTFRRGGERQELGHRKRKRKRRKGQADFILSAARRHLLALSTHWTYAVALCHLKQFFQLKLKFSLLILQMPFFPFFPLAWGTDR